MAMNRKTITAVVLIAALAGCGSGTEQSNAGVAAGAIASLFNPPEISQLTATRAGLEASGFDQPLLVATLTEPIEIKAGLLLDSSNQGVSFWRGGDGSIVKEDGGVLRGTVGVPYDLYGADTDTTLAALSGGQTESYLRVFRHLNALNQLDVTRFFCEMSAPTAERIVVFDRQHQTLRFSERCVADAPSPQGTVESFENTYWKDPNRLFLWRSEQWISDKTGTILLERVFE